MTKIYRAYYSNKTESEAYQQSVFKRYHSDKHFSEFLPTRWRQKTNWHTYGTKLRHRHPCIPAIERLPVQGATA